jgi:hypothetical protein
MKKQIPLAVAFVSGFFLFVQYYIPHRISSQVGNRALEWLVIVSTFALLLGVVSLVRIHIVKIQRRHRDWPFSAITIVSLLAMAFVGFAYGREEGSPFIWMFRHIQIPIEATMFSLLAFYMASAAFRAFRVKSFDATLLLLSAAVVMLGRVSIGRSIGIPELTDWVLEVPNTATKRGILIGVALGMIATALKIMLGIERSYLGGGD